MDITSGKKNGLTKLGTKEVLVYQVQTLEKKIDFDGNGGLLKPTIPFDFIYLWIIAILCRAQNAVRSQGNETEGRIVLQIRRNILTDTNWLCFFQINGQVFFCFASFKFQNTNF